MLDEAVLEARRSGSPCDGWMLQGSDDGFAAWVYRDDDDEGQVSLLDHVEVMPSAGAAARWVLEQMRQGQDQA